MAEPDATSSISSAVPPPPAPRTARVYVVDDEPMVTQSIVAMLALETDWEVYPFNSPQEALDSLEPLPPDVVVSDFLMPDMDGIAFLTEVKDRLPETTAILLTGYADKENAIRAINAAGIYRYLEKPWDNDQLRISIQNGLERTHLLNDLHETIGALTTARNHLAQHNEKLEHMVAERTQELHHTYNQLVSIFSHTADGIVTLDHRRHITSANPAVQSWLEGRDSTQLTLENMGSGSHTVYATPSASPGHDKSSAESPHTEVAEGITTAPAILSSPGSCPSLYGMGLEALFLPKQAELFNNALIQQSQEEKPSEVLAEATVGKVPVELTISPIPDNPGYVIVLRDISKRKEAERLREDFVSTLTHDLRTPLLAAIQTLEFFVDGTVGELAPSQRELLTMLISSNRDMLGLVNVLLEVYKYESGRQQLILDQVNLSTLLEQICKELDALAQSRSIHLKLAFAPPESLVWGDKQELRRVFVNLIGNALHFTPADGRVDITIEALQANGHPAQWLVNVVDTGRGIPADDIPKLFQRFSQGTSKKRESGTGLGLYLSRQIIDAHRGSIAVESTEGEGSRFYVELPQYQPKATPAPVGQQDASVSS